MKNKICGNCKYFSPYEKLELNQFYNGVCSIKYPISFKMYNLPETRYNETANKCSFWKKLKANK